MVTKVTVFLVLFVMTSVVNSVYLGMVNSVVPAVVSMLYLVMLHLMMLYLVMNAVAVVHWRPSVVRAVVPTVGSSENSSMGMLDVMLYLLNKVFYWNAVARVYGRSTMVHRVNSHHRRRLLNVMDSWLSGVLRWWTSHHRLGWSSIHTRWRRATLETRWRRATLVARLRRTTLVTLWRRAAIVAIRWALRRRE